MEVIVHSVCLSSINLEAEVNTKKKKKEHVDDILTHLIFAVNVCAEQRALFFSFFFFFSSKYEAQSEKFISI